MQSKYKILLVIIVLANCVHAQIPILNSYSTITNKVIYLDFDGQVVSGTAWNSGNTVNAVPSTMTSAQIIQIWKRISEDYRPFDVNITTDSVRFNNAPANRRIRVVVTPTSSWYGSAGGVAYVGSFTWGGTPGTPCWVFENQLGYSPKNIAEAAAHEVGHTLTLKHHSTYSNTPTTCTKTAEYNPGIGTGVTSWAPIMGVGYSKNVTIWHFGPNTNGCNVIQYDHGSGNPGITGLNYLAFLPDDVGNTLTTSKILNLSSVNLVDSGLITTPADLDAYQFTICNNRYVSVNVKPWALDTVNYQGANLDVRLHLYNATTNSVLAVDTPLTKLHGLVGLNLTPGTYYFTIDGGRSNNYNDYGSLGRYYISIKATNPPTLANTIVSPPGLCVAQTTTLNYTSNGTPNTWQWTVTGPTSTTYNVQSPSLAFSPAGIYTITLLATGSSSPSCPTTITLSVNSAPTLSVSGTSATLCAGKNTTLVASGASSYTWLPGGFSGSTQIVSPMATTNYTVKGSNGTCDNNVMTTVNVYPNFTLTAAASKSQLCAGESLTLTASGANSYTFNPGGTTTNPAVLTPANSTTYIVTGNSSSNCSKTFALPIVVYPHYNVNVNSSDSAICPGNSATLIASGANTYTFHPGGTTGYMVVVTPTASTNYTVTGINGNQCTEQNTIIVAVKLCDFVGIEKHTAQKDVRIYPNPAGGQIHIESPTETGTLALFNSLGKIVYSKTLREKNNVINTEHFARGVYFVKLYSGNQFTRVEKIILE